MSTLVQCTVPSHFAYFKKYCCRSVEATDSATLVKGTHKDFKRKTHKLSRQHHTSSQNRTHNASAIASRSRCNAVKHRGKGRGTFSLHHPVEERK